MKNLYLIKTINNIFLYVVAENTQIASEMVEKQMLSWNYAEKAIKVINIELLASFKNEKINSFNNKILNLLL